MKVVLLSSSSGSRGGGEFYLKNLATGLLDRGHEVLLVCANHPRMEELAATFETMDVAVKRIPYTNTYDRRFRSLSAFFDNSFGKPISELIDSLKPTLVHLNQQNVEDALELLRSLGRCGTPVVTTVHQPGSMAELEAFGGRVRDFVSRRTFASSGIDAIAVSQASAKQLATILKRNLVDVDGENCFQMRDESPVVFAVNNGISRPQHADGHRVRQQFGIHCEGIVLGCLARIEHEKNPFFVVDLLARLPQNYSVFWIGDGRLRNELEVQIKDKGLESRFIIAGWQDSAAQLLSAVDIFILPSLYEGLPLALLEAMALGIPSIVSDVKGTADAVDHGIEGLRCSVQRLDDWIAAIESIANSPATQRQLSANASRRFDKDFSLAAMTNKTLNVYEWVLEKRASRS